MRQVAIGTWRCFCPEARVAGEARDAEMKRRIESFHRELQKIAGYNVDFNITINGGCLEAIVDDLRFVAYEMMLPKEEERSMLVTLLGRCPSCGAETLSEPFFDLVGLGKILDEFVPIAHHYSAGRCQKAASKNKFSPPEKLVK